MITIPNWMFLPTFENMRSAVFNEAPITSLVHNGRGVWGSDFGSCSFVLRRGAPIDFTGRFLKLFEKQGSVSDNDVLEQRFHSAEPTDARNSEFKRVPRSPVAYWLSKRVREIFRDSSLLGDLVHARQGLATADNNQFVRLWHEVDGLRVGYGLHSRDAASTSRKKWFPYNKGGDFRKWYGNQEFIVNWENDGRDLFSFKPRSVIRNPEYYFLPSLSWSDITSGPASFRIFNEGFIHDVTGMSAFKFDKIDRDILACYCNTPIVISIARAINPTLHFQIGDFSNIPYLEEVEAITRRHVVESFDSFISVARNDWNSYERSWDFQSLSILTASNDPTPILESSYTTWIAQNRETINEMKRLEEENNRLFIDAYGLQDELTPEVPIEQITLTVNPAYRYGTKLSEEEQWTRFREDTMKELVSYAIGCAMGRYSLDEPGLIYAHSENVGFDPNRYRTFPADGDGIIPITEMDWFDDDATHRLVEFISVAWDRSHLEENLAFLAANLSPKKGETNRETLRRYLADRFFKDHLQTYKKRPIYWCFSSGRQKAFQCLVYLHRYHSGTLARMRMEYVVPLQSKMAARIDSLADDIQAASSSAQAKRLQKERDTLTKQLEELRRFDEQLRHYADQRIALDLDDGVKVNYGKFGDLLAEVKAVTGTSAD